MDWIFVSGKKIPSIRKEAIVDSRIFLRSTGRTGIICTVFLIVLFMLQIYKFYLQNQHFFARKIVQKAEKIPSRKQKKGIAFFDINQASDARFHLFLRENKKCSSNANKFFGRQLLQMMDLAPELIGEGLSYMRIVGGCAFLQAVALTLSAILRSHNMAYYPMRVTLLMNILNIIGNYTLIFGKFGMPALGVEGAAISTSTCRLIAMLLLAYLLFRKVTPRIPLSLFRPFPIDKLRNLLYIGLPAAGEQISYSLSQVVVTYFTILVSTAARTARTYAMNIVMFTYVFAIAIGQGGAICIGHLVGADKTHAAYVLQRYCMKISVLISLIMAVITAGLGKFIFSFLTNNPEVVHLGIIILCVDILLEVGRAVNILSVNVLNAVGDVTYPFITGVIVMWGVATYLSYVFGIQLGWGLAGMWFAFLLDENIRAVIFVRRWNSRKWIGKTFTKVKPLSSSEDTLKAA